MQNLIQIKTLKWLIMAHKSQWGIKLDAAHSESVQISLKLSAAGINSLSIVFIFTLNSWEEGNPGMQSSQHLVNSNASCNCLQYYMLHVFNIILINDLTIGWQNLNPLSHPNGNTSTTSKAKWWNFELFTELLVWYPQEWSLGCCLASVSAGIRFCKLECCHQGI